jgi:(E)-4-hydroxy-3-methylbut-2-enyl-diphosphate synthase
MDSQSSFVRYGPPRRKSRKIWVGSVAVGSDAPVSVQSMTTTKTADSEGTLQQIYALAGAGADIVRVTCNEAEAAEALAAIVPRSPVPIVADIHFQYRLALAAIEAGVHAVRINPGNIKRPEHIRAVAKAAKKAGIPIRVGVNAGSLDKDVYARWGGATPEALVESALSEVALLEDEGFSDIKISVKASSVPLMIAAYRLLASRCDYPLHLGVTEAGPPPEGVVKSVAGIGTLLAEGIGDTIRFSLAADPVEEVKAARELLETLGLRERSGVDLVACPSCGRAEIDVIKLATLARDELRKQGLPLQVAVMGCVVNGPGEAREADLGLAAGRSGAHLFIKGKVVRVLKLDASAADPYEAMVRELVDEACRVAKDGIEARLAAADVEAARVAEAEALELSSAVTDPNRVSDRKIRIRAITRDS